jgi:hydroxymethylpyrimidine/phosphomethylpyrimidine kinase
VREQIELLLKNFPIAAIKTGLLCNAEIVAQVVRSLGKVKRRRLVVDPVMISTSGRVLLEPEAIRIYQRDLFPLATLITPNLDEATGLLGIGEAPTTAREGACAPRKNVSLRVLLFRGTLRAKMNENFLVSEFAVVWSRHSPRTIVCFRYRARTTSFFDQV